MQWTCESGDPIMGIKPGDLLEVGVDVGDGEVMPDMVRIAGKCGLLYDGKLDFGVGDKPSFTIHAGGNASIELGDRCLRLKQVAGDTGPDLVAEHEIVVERVGDHVELTLRGTKFIVDPRDAELLAVRLDNCARES